MVQFLMEAGPLIWPIIVLTWVIGILVLLNVLMLLLRRRGTAAQRRHRIDAVLFWGGVAAVLGFLGQWIGVQRMTVAIAERGVVSPNAVVYGLSESLLTSIAGMAVLVLAGFLWLALRIGLWTAERRA